MRSGSLALVVLAVGGSPALAVTPLTTTVSSDQTGNTVTTSPSLLAERDSGTGTTTVNGTTSATGVSLGQFDTSTGILVGAQVNVSGVGTAVNANVAASGGTGTATATANLAGAVSGPGFSIGNDSATATQGCTDAECPATPTGPSASSTAATISGSATIASNSLAAYAGTGSVTLERSATGSSEVTLGGGFTSGASAASYSFSGGSYAIDYSYLNFAVPSLRANTITDTITINFGTVFRNGAFGGGPVSRSFRVYNLGNANSADLELVSITRDTNDAVFSSNVAPFSALAAGSNQMFTVTLDPATVGNKIDRFRLALRDAAPDGSVGEREYTLDVQVQAFVTAVVPEPATWAMFIAGFGLTGATLRRRRALAA